MWDGIYFIHENNGEGQDLKIKRGGGLWKCGIIIIINNINGVIRKKGFGEKNGGGGREVWWRRR